MIYQIKDFSIFRILASFLAILSTILTFMTIYIKPSHITASQFGLGFPFQFIFYNDTHLPPEGIFFVFTPPHILLVHFQLLGFFLNWLGIFSILLIVMLLVTFLLRLITGNQEA